VNNGRMLPILLGATTIALVVIGTVWPVPSAAAYAGSRTLITSSSTPEAAVRSLGDEIRTQSWEKCYASLTNNARFTEPEFVHDLTGW
jgi:hypothetical protein